MHKLFYIVQKMMMAM